MWFYPIEAFLYTSHYLNTHKYRDVWVARSIVSKRKKNFQNMTAILNGFIGINTSVPFYKYFVLLTHEEKQIA